MFHLYRKGLLLLLTATWFLQGCSSVQKNFNEGIAMTGFYYMAAASIPAAVLWKCLGDKGLTDSEINSIEMDFSYSVSFDADKKHLKISSLTWKNPQTKRKALDSCKRSLSRGAEKELANILLKKESGKKSRLVLDVNGTTFSKDFHFKARDSSEIKGTFKVPGSGQSAK